MKTIHIRQANIFDRQAKKIAHLSGNSVCFMLAFLLIIAWLFSGPLFKFSDTWQLIINTSTTIITFLMVFIIQNTQNRDTEAMQLKLDELLRSNVKANNALMDLEELDDESLMEMRQEYLSLAEVARAETDKRDRRRSAKIQRTSRS